MVFAKDGVEVKVGSSVAFSRKKLFVPHIFINFVPRKSFLLMVGYNRKFSHF